MLIITDPAELAPYVGCAFVPTMGALHDGHLSLIKEAKKSGTPVVVSIFVNPTQFAPNEDYDKYPRNLEQDASFAEDVGADVVFAPSVETMYPSLPPSEITIPSAAAKPKLEDACRPEHFQGVCIAVARLFDLVQPSLTVFGLKDYQQFLVIKQLIELERAFWHLVETDTPPDADGSDSADQALRALYPHDDGEALDLIDDAALNGDFNEMLDIRDRLTRLSEREARLKQRIQQRMGDAARAYFMDGQVSWKRSKDSTVLDTDALLKTQPALLQQFPKHRAGSRRFLFGGT